ncbi:hypothetical protein BDZ89DRAFT_1064136 [Hymenopellis radicata]|nr:hypothetical protein BDZ89DRAFT_1064136 [Hymenopellis radicata]
MRGAEYKTQEGGTAIVKEDVRLTPERGRDDERGLVKSETQKRLQLGGEVKYLGGLERWRARRKVAYPEKREGSRCCLAGHDGI